MKHISSKISLLLMCFMLVGTSAYAEAYKYAVKKPAKKAELERCRRGQGSAELSINNVRARINTSGNMWYDGSTARYFVPKDGNSTAMFCAALWVGGQDANLQLRVAALRFGQDGDDFWPGPLTVDANASVDKAVCEQWDKHFKITKAEVEYFVDGFEYQGETFMGVDASRATEAIKTWPAHGDVSKNQSKFMAPFFDRNGDGVYSWEDGDYPYYDLSGELCPTKMKANLPPGVPYTPTPTMESDTTNPNYGTGGVVKAYGGLLVDQVLKGDETIWWVFNDKGNAHTESKSENPIGLEIRAQAFAFAMNDEINNMTFYSYEIINRSTFTLTNTYFSQWVDPDLGYAADDFVGCDVERGLGYCYNGKATDGPGTGAYSGNPPAIGIDFFQGPYMDPDGRDNPKVDPYKVEDVYGPAALEPYKENGVVNNILLTEDAYKFKDCWYPKSGDSVDACAINGVNFGNGIVDDERFGMRRFIYYNNSTANNGEPDKAMDYYNYLRGIWKDNSKMTYGGDGYKAENGTNKDIQADFMFPGNSDIWGWGTRTGGNEAYGRENIWTEETAGNAADDRRFMQSAGPFTLEPGAINYITVGIPFAQAASGGPMASVELLRQIDDKCQALFDNCFNVLEGPDAPNVVVQELDREIILYLTNEAGNNVNEAFEAEDVTIPRSYDVKDSSGNVIETIDYDRKYRFEGYQIFQLKDASVSVADIYDPAKSRLIAQCDIENYDSLQNNQPIAKLVNYTKTNDLLGGQVMVDGENKGIRHSFKITEDKFAETNDKRIVNNKKYYYIAIAYAYNNFKQYNPEDATKLDGQKLPYLASRKLGGGGSIAPVVAIPHMTNSEQNGTLLQSSYGMSPEVIRLEGQGNGGLVLNFDKATTEQLMGKRGEEALDENGNPVNFVPTPVYSINYGPLNVKIVDPLAVRTGSYILKIVPGEGTMNEAYWEITNANGGEVYEGVDVIRSSRPIGEINEEIIFELGLSIQLTNPKPLAGSNASTITAGEAKGGEVIAGALLSSSITFADPSKTWLYGMADNDASQVTDWIRAGGVTGSDAEDLSNAWLDYFHTGIMGSLSAIKTPMDSKSEFENCVGGWWAPYRLTSVSYDYVNNRRTEYVHPAFTDAYYYDSSNEFDIPNENQYNPGKLLSLISNDMNNLASVDIVFTNDESKWTRCPVIELGNDPLLTQGGAKAFSLRKSASVGKDGKEDGTGDGMGWFPGYAINLETGERLNIIFGENSALGHQNGRDMLWNPTVATSDAGGVVFGGMHYIYVLGTSEVPVGNNVVKPTRYDQGAWAYNILKGLSEATGVSDASANVARIRAAHELFATVMWVGIPLATCFESGSANVDLEKRAQSLIPTDATVSIRVRKPYEAKWSKNAQGTNDNPQNDNNPMYQFSIDGGLATVLGHTETAQSALDNITVVPNPYYGASLYEQDQIQNLVKITNLPPDCYITIYALDGTVVRKLRGPSASLVSGGGTALTSIDWDLKNHKGLPISGGVYLIHIKADGVGEKLIKWFGALRPVDLNSFQ
ncbi:MAG: hypothetical protein J6U84_02310 [Bacteroidales bacterium]|nr:hypothetical protein [Bacteroidales bacterium]